MAASPSAADPVEVALAAALSEATKAAQWETVALLAGELRARREARERDALTTMALGKVRS